jgi:hypothetical protein
LRPGRSAGSLTGERNRLIRRPHRKDQITRPPALLVASPKTVDLPAASFGPSFLSFSFVQKSDRFEVFRISVHPRHQRSNQD